MGIGISRWPLARSVARAGQLGVVSGVALDSVVARTLQLGDPGGNFRRALARFPAPAIATRVLGRYYREGGISPQTPFLLPSPPRQVPSREQEELLMTANFAEVFLAREGHDGPVGINYLEKLQMFTLPGLYGAMLAGVEYVLMGAGIPREIPGVIERLAAHEDAALRLSVHGAGPEDDFQVRFSPRAHLERPPPLQRPRFLAIVSSTTLARMLAKLRPESIDGLVIESSTAGGHNAPPRMDAPLSDTGEPVYGPKDQVDLDAIRALGLPFWLAGSCGTPEGLRAALAEGAAGIQAGTAFALCRESGLAPELKARLLQRAERSELEIFTDATASPTGLPFKVARLEGTLSDPEVYEQRQRICDAGGLRQPFRKSDGTLDYRCPAEPIASYLAKGGRVEDTHNRKCLCNALLANAGLGQRRGESVEKPLVTLGSDVAAVTRFMPPGGGDYDARMVIDALLAGL